MQLVEPCVDMFDTMKNQRIRAEEVIEKFGVGPEKVGDVLALMGDSVETCRVFPVSAQRPQPSLFKNLAIWKAYLAAAPDMKPSKMRDNLIDLPRKHGCRRCW